MAGIGESKVEPADAGQFCGVIVDCTREVDDELSHLLPKLCVRRANPGYPTVSVFSISFGNQRFDPKIWMIICI